MFKPFFRYQKKIFSKLFVIYQNCFINVSEKENVMEKKQSGSGRIIAGVLIIALGTLILLDNLNILPYDATRLIFSWPMIMAVIGIVSLMFSENKTVGIVFTVIGVVFLIPRIYPNVDIDMSIIIPILIIFLGLYLVFKRNSPGKKIHTYFKRNEITDNDTLDELVVFGGSSKSIRSDNFKGGQVTTIFGGAELDLKNCKLAEPKRQLDIVAIFGGVEITVPSDWSVHVDVLPIFGGFSNKKYQDKNEVIPGERVLQVKGIVIFGGGEIKYR